MSQKAPLGTKSSPAQVLASRRRKEQDNAERLPDREGRRHPEMVRRKPSTKEPKAAQELEGRSHHSGGLLRRAHAGELSLHAIRVLHGVEIRPEQGRIRCPDDSRESRNWHIGLCSSRRVDKSPETGRSTISAIGRTAFNPPTCTPGPVRTTRTTPRSSAKKSCHTLPGYSTGRVGTVQKTPLLQRLLESNRYDGTEPWEPVSQPAQRPLEEFTCPGHDFAITMFGGNSRICRTCETSEFQERMLR